MLVQIEKNRTAKGPSTGTAKPRGRREGSSRGRGASGGARPPRQAGVIAVSIKNDSGIRKRGPGPRRVSLTPGSVRFVSVFYSRQTQSRPRQAGVIAVSNKNDSSIRKRGHGPRRVSFSFHKSWLCVHGFTCCSSPDTEVAGRKAEESSRLSTCAAVALELLQPSIRGALDVTRPCLQDKLQCTTAHIVSHPTCCVQVPQAPLEAPPRNMVQDTGPVRAFACRLEAVCLTPFSLLTSLSCLQMPQAPWRLLSATYLHARGQQDVLVP